MSLDSLPKAYKSLLLVLQISAVVITDSGISGTTLTANVTAINVPMVCPRD